MSQSRGTAESSMPQSRAAAESPGQQSQTAGKSSPPLLVTMASVQPQPVDWLYYPYIPKGKLTLLRADGGSGKTWLTLHMAAVCSSGGSFLGEDAAEDCPFPRREPAHVLLCNAEDGYRDTLRPRLDKMGGGDLSRIHLPDARVQVNGFDDPVLAKLMEDCRPALAVFDPLQSYLGAQVDMHRANEVRPVLDVLAKLAERFNCAVVIVEHINKSAKTAVQHRGIGSVDFTNRARSVLLIGQNPEDPGESVLAPVKSNLAPFGQSIAFEIQEDGPHFRGFSPLCADDLLAARQARAARENPTDEVAQQIRDMLEKEPRVDFAKVKAWATQNGVSDRALRRAREQLGLRSHSEGRGNERVTWWTKA